MSSESARMANPSEEILTSEATNLTVMIGDAGFVINK
jgi:hypothetical protein